MDNFQVAIDGPAGSGKSSISSLVADKLNFTHLDTGAMYRAVCLEALRRKIDLDDENQYDFLNNIKILNVKKHTYLNDVDVSKEIRSEEVSSNVSRVSKLKIVREKMVEFQRHSALTGKVLMDGRDIGTTVLPNANVKIFLTASVECRALRRYKELQASGSNASLDDIKKSIEERDYMDSHREISPLVKAFDAILVDTTSMTIEEVCNKIVEIIEKRMNNMEQEKSFEELLNESIKDLKVGDLVKGKVVSFIDDNTCAVSIEGAYTEGIIHLDHYDVNVIGKKFSDFVKIGDEIEAVVTKVSQDETNQILLSRLDIAKKNAATKFVSENDGKPFSVVVSRTLDKGYITHSNGVRFFLPKNDVSKELKKGDKVNVVLLKFDEEKSQGLVSAKALERAIEAEEKAKELEAIHVGDVISGEVCRIEPYGIFVQFNKLRGVVRLKELSHEYIENPTSKYQLGQKVDAKIISLENGRIDLSFKALTKAPIELYAETHKVSDEVSGIVAQKLPFGIILKLDENVTGLLHRNEFSWNPNDNLDASLKIGDTLNVAITAIDVSKKKISLSRKALIDNPWSRVQAKKGDLIDAKVLEVTPKGLKIEALGVDGFISAKDINLENGSNKLQDSYQVGDEVKAFITKVDPKSWILNASIKAYQDDLARKEFEKYQDMDKEKDTPTTIGDILNNKNNK